MKNIGFILAIIVLANIGTLNGQKSTKWQAAIAQIEKSEFVQEHQKNKALIEKTIAEFKASQDNLDEKDIELIKKGYEQSKANFDSLFDGMKNDFSNKKVRKYISRDPDHYFRGFRYDLDNAMKTYRNSCERQIHHMVELEEAAFGLGEITIILGLIKEFGNLVSKHINKMNKMSADYFETHFIAKQRLKDWNSY